MIANDIAILIRDAISNFQSIRTPPNLYVERYKYTSQKHKEEKIKQVQARLDISSAIYNLSQAIAEEFESRINLGANLLEIGNKPESKYPEKEEDFQPYLDQQYPYKPKVSIDDPNYKRDSNLNPEYEYKVALFHGLGKFSVHKQTGKVCECEMNWNEEGTILSCPICGLDGT